MVPVIKGGATLLSQAPAVLETVQKSYPSVYRKVSSMWQKAGGGNVVSAVAGAVAKGDANIAKAMFEMLLKSGLRSKQLVAAMPNVSEEDLSQFLGKVSTSMAQDRELSDRNVTSQGTGLEVLASKAVQVTRIQRLLGLSTDEIVEVMTFMNTTTTEQLRLVQEMRLATQGVR